MAKRYVVAIRSSGESAAFSFPTLAKANSFAASARRKGWEAIVGKPVARIKRAVTKKSKRRR